MHQGMSPNIVRFGDYLTMEESKRVKERGQGNQETCKSGMENGKTPGNLNRGL